MENNIIENNATEITETETIVTEITETEDIAAEEKATKRTKKKKTPLDYIRIVLMVIFASVFLVSAGIMVSYYIDSAKQKKQYDALAELVQKNQSDQSLFPNIFGGGNGTDSENSDGSLSTYVEVTDPVTGETVNVLQEYAEVYQMNPDMVGWIRINNTNINYPVMQAPDSVNYYLKRDFFKKYSRHGSIYANETADLIVPSDNVTLYGHNMNDGSMFADLHKYTDKKYYAQNPYIVFDTIYEHHLYQIFAVFPTTDTSSFAYHTFVTGTPEDFEDFVMTCSELALYDTGVTASYGDKLLTLSTCDSDYIDDHGRFVVVAKRIA